LAARLSESGRRVGLVEAGPDYGPYADGRWPEDMLDGRRLAFSHAWETDREDRSQLRARIVGGCSAHNACIMLEGAPADYDEWGEGWSYDAIEPYLRRAERQMRVRQLEPAELSPWHRAFARTCGDAAIVHPVNAMGTGIGPERGLPVGAGLIDHVGVGFGYEGTDRLQRDVAVFERSHPLFMAQVTVATSSSACAPGLSDLFFFPGLDPPGAHGYEVSVAVFAMKPASRGVVRLHSSDPRAPLSIDHGFLSEPTDATVLAEGVESLRRLAEDDAVRVYAGREVRPGPEVDAMTHVRRTARGFFHPVATCAIGRVVDGDGHVYGLDGLVVADASIMPTIPRANTNLSTVALADRLAQNLGES